ncbi:lysosomal alpha-glucosidase [Clonorchis sinensis]|uniref:Lysosomal alpha-glucosidase n=1 Tax=Clonorchis sinensis TaxID=79923 RepID=H2KPA9_CLOSI|nr:lysosomal alpha-glucosidase [Clonorchis sinensis]
MLGQTWLLLLVFGSSGLASNAVNSLPPQCGPFPISERLDCYPEAGANKDACINKGCCWSGITFTEPHIPMCYFPKDYRTYTVRNVTQNPRGFVADMEKITSPYGVNEFQNVRVEVLHETKTRLRVRFTIPSDPNRWEPPIPLGKPDVNAPEPTDYAVELEKSPFGIRVVRNDPIRQMLLDSTGDMSVSTIFSDQFLQTSFRLGAEHGFGPGEVRADFPHWLRRTWLRMGLWTRDNAPMKEANLYGVHNFFMGLSPDGSAFGVFLINSNAQEVVLTPLPAITYRTIGGILDFFIFTGPDPMDVTAQYLSLIGHPLLPPYWSLGFHLCRFGYRDSEEVANTVERNIKAGIPVDAQWIDIDYMDAYRVWTVDPTKFGGLPSLIQDTLHSKYGIRNVLIVDPAVSAKDDPTYAPFLDGFKRGIFINDSRTGSPIEGVVWPGDTVFPDFSHPEAEAWLYNLASEFHKSVPFDGLWIDMNEPASFAAGSKTNCDQTNPLDNPPFVPPILDRSLYAKTVCPSALHHDSTHYNRHNLYGYDHARVTHNVLKQLFAGKRPFLLSRSTFSGSGLYTIHWTGDNLSSWPDMRASIAQIINFNLFGIPMVGADICGFRGNTTEELCVRWSQLGAFYPFARNHNDLASIPQDPAVWSKAATEAIRDAIKLRYLLLPYMYSLFYRAHLNGTTVARALSFEFPRDTNTHTVKEQFMLGSCILVTPVLDEGRTDVTGYVPAGYWINLSTGRRDYSTGQVKYFQAPLNVIPILVRGGCVVPFQTSFEVTKISRKKGIALLVVLSTTDDGTLIPQTGTAKGELFWDDGEADPLNYVYVNFTVANRELHIVPKPLNADTIRSIDPQETQIKSILINGLSQEPKQVLLNKAPVAYTFDEKLQTVRIGCPESTHFTSKIIVTWEF